MMEHCTDTTAEATLQPADRDLIASLELQHTLLTAIPALVIVAASPAYLIHSGKWWLDFPRSVILYAQLVSNLQLLPWKRPSHQE